MFTCFIIHVCCHVRVFDIFYIFMLHFMSQNSKVRDLPGSTGRWCPLLDSEGLYRCRQDTTEPIGADISQVFVTRKHRREFLLRPPYCWAGGLCPSAPGSAGGALPAGERHAAGHLRPSAGTCCPAELLRGAGLRWDEDGGLLPGG